MRTRSHRRALSAVALCIVVGGALAAPAAAGQLSLSQDAITSVACIASTQAVTIGQSFTAPRTGDITGLAVHSSHARTETLTVYAGAGTAGAVIHTQAVDLSAMGFTLNPMPTVPLTSPVPVAEGQLYTFTLTGGQCTGDPAGFGIDTRNPYAGGVLYSSASTQPAYDLRFRLELENGTQADAGIRYFVAEGDSVALDASASVSAPTGPPTYAWDLDDDGAFDDASDVAPSLAAIDLGGPGNYTIRVRVTDSDGFTDVASATVTVTNVLPVLHSFTVDPVLVDEGGSVSATAVWSTVEGDPVTATFDWGDGTDASAAPSGTAVPHTFAASGSYIVTVLLADDDGYTVGLPVDVEVSNVDPTIAYFSLDATSVVLGQGVTASGSFSDVPSDVLTASVDWGDGTPVAAVTSPFSVGHTFATAGQFDVVLTVDDEEGGSASQTVTVTVLSPAQAVDNLIARITASSLKSNLKTGVISPLRNANRSLEAGNAASACSQLSDFINVVQSKTPKPISSALATAWIADAEVIRSAIGCP